MTDRYDDAVAFVRTTKNTSVSGLQYGLELKYGEALLYIERMQADGILTAPLATGKRNIIKQKPKYTAAQLLASG